MQSRSKLKQMHMLGWFAGMAAAAQVCERNAFTVTSVPQINYGAVEMTNWGRLSRVP